MTDRRLFAPALLACALFAAPLVAHAAAPTAPAAAAPKAASSAFHSDRITVEVTGSGPDLILIPGLASSPQVWDALVARYGGQYRLHRVQLAGFAGLAAPADTTQVVAPAVAELRRYIETQGLKRPAVIGHSLGGASGLMLAEQAPDLVGRLMIVDSLPFYSVLFGPTATVESARPFADQMFAQITSQPDDAFAQGQARTMVALVKTEAAREQPLKWSLASDRATIASAVKELMTTDLRPGLPAVKTPVTVVYAADPSSGIPTEAADALYKANYATLPGVRLVRVDDARHFLMLDQPERFLAEVGVFLK